MPIGHWLTCWGRRDINLKEINTSQFFNFDVQCNAFSLVDYVNGCLQSFSGEEHRKRISSMG